MNDNQHEREGGSLGFLIQCAFVVGSVALLLAMSADAIAVLGRHVGWPLLGSIELVQTCIVLAAAAAMVIATLHDTHARLHVSRGAYPARAISQRSWQRLPMDLKDVLERSLAVWQQALTEESPKHNKPACSSRSIRAYRSSISPRINRRCSMRTSRERLRDVSG